MTKSIKIGIDTKTTLPMSYLEPMQGDLKDLSDESCHKLRRSILKHGFIFPLFVWEDENDVKFKIIDGHQRLKVLNDLKDDGYSIPQLPVVLIPASSIEQAKERLAIAASTYGKFNEKGVKSFFESFEFDSEELFEQIEIPFLDFSSLNKEDVAKKIEVTAHAREISLNDEKQEYLIVISCQSEADQSDTYERLKDEGYECKIIS